MELWAIPKTVQNIAVSKLIVSSQEIAPEITTSIITISDEPTEVTEIETTTDNLESTEPTTEGFDSTEATTDLSSSTTSSNTEAPQATVSPKPTTGPPRPVFPDLWSLLLGIVIGIILTSLLVFVSTCFWWAWGDPGKKIMIAKDPAYMLPRLEVVSNSSQKSITGSVGGSQTISIDPFWIKSKGWSHIP